MVANTKQCLCGFAFGTDLIVCGKHHYKTVTERDRWRELADNLARFGNCSCDDCKRDFALTYQEYEQAMRDD